MNVIVFPVVEAPVTSWLNENLLKVYPVFSGAVTETVSPNLIFFSVVPALPIKLPSAAVTLYSFGEYVTLIITFFSGIVNEYDTLSAVLVPSVSVTELPSESLAVTVQSLPSL